MTVHKVDLAVVSREVVELLVAIQRLQDTEQSHRIYRPRRRNSLPPLPPGPTLGSGPEPLPTPPPNQSLPRRPRDESLEAAKETYRVIVLRIKWLQAYWGDPELIDAPLTVRRSLSNLQPLLRRIRQAESSPSPMPADLLDNLNVLLQQTVKCLRETVPRDITADKGQPVEIDDDAENKRPIRWLASWSEILRALDLRMGDKGKVTKLNKSYGGPISIGTQGKQPTANEAKLLDWWNSLEAKVKEHEQRQRDAKATTSSSHNYGRDGTVLPDLSGGIKKRRTK